MNISSLTNYLPLSGGTLTGQTNIVVSGETVPNIKFSNNTNRITRDVSETFLFNGAQGYIAIGNTTTRSSSIANLHMGSQGVDASIESIASNGSSYMPLSFYASTHTFVGNVLMNNTLNVTGSITTGSISTNKYMMAADYRGGMSPSQQETFSMGYYFGTYANNGNAPFADILTFNGWNDTSAGNTTMLAFSKDVDIRIRQWSNLFGQTTPFNRYRDCVMTDLNS